MIYLVRHGAHSLLDRVLCGRSQDVALSERGLQQADQLARHFSGIPLDVVRSSPRRRARETAAPIAQVHDLRVDCAADIDELDAGEWSGRSFESLASDPEWHRWNVSRGSARPPGGERMAELQTRVVAHVETLVAKCLNAVIVSHAEPIRATLLHYRGMSLDQWSEIEVQPASVSIVEPERMKASGRRANVLVPP